MTARFGVLGDVHSEDVAVAAALELFERERVEKVLAVGDVIDGPGDPHRTISLLLDHDVVRGNHDRWYFDRSMHAVPDATPRSTLDEQERTWLAALPSVRSYDTPRGPLMLCHGLASDDMTTLKPDDFGYGISTNEVLQELIAGAAYRFVVSGHSHRRMVRKLGAVTFINAGTLLRTDDPCVLVLDLKELSATFHDWRQSTYVSGAPIALP